LFKKYAFDYEGCLAASQRRIWDSAEISWRLTKYVSEGNILVAHVVLPTLRYSISIFIPSSWY